jgi:hypothetical protein
MGQYNYLDSRMPTDLLRREALYKILDDFDIT